MRHLCESGLRENRTGRLSGGRRPAPRGASSDPTPVKRGDARGGKDPGWSRPLEGHVPGPTEPHQETATKLQRIAWLSARDPSKRFDNLMHLFNEESLAACFHELDGRKAVGVDGVTKAAYGEHLEENLRALVERMRRMGYRPGAVRQVLIPKPGKRGAQRPLGIGNLEDKLVQMQMGKVLEAIYEPTFLGCSYGFRPGRGAHDALKALHQHLYRHEVRTVIDVDARFLRYLARMFKAGVLAEGELRVSDEGVLQGSPCSPVLANIFAHRVIDEWFEGTVKRHCRGETALFRYADDLCICCQSERDVHRVLKALKGGLARYGLALNESKTRLVPFARPRDGRRQHRAVFELLGFTFYWGRSRRGYPVPKVKTSGRRLRAKLQALYAWWKRVHSRAPLSWLWPIFCAKLRGHLRYYGVSFNTPALYRFVYQAVRIAYKWLNRRSQRRSFTWETFRGYIERHPLPRVQVYQPLY